MLKKKECNQEVNLYYRCCEKEPTISYVDRYKNFSKKTILRKSWASLVSQVTEHDKIIILHDEVSPKTLNWMESKLTSGLVEFVQVPVHDFEYHQHTITLVEELEKRIQDNNETHFLVEDDYLFKSNALNTLRSLDGIYQGFFVPYDYPDRYREKILSQVILGPTCHWRTINSCTMTIGASAQLWKKVMPIIHKAAPTSNDKVFEEIFKTYACISPIPGVATHLTASHHTPYFNVDKRLEELDIV